MNTGQLISPVTHPRTQKEILADVPKLTEIVLKIHADLYVGNGEPSLRQQIRDIKRELDSFIAATNAERARREKREEEERRKAEDWRSWVGRELIRYLIPFAMFYLANVIINS